MDSSTIINNVARFENKEGYPQGVYYAVHSDKEFVQFILGADQEFSIRTNLPENLVNTQIEGSKENQLFLESRIYDLNYEAKVKPLNDIIKAGLKNSAEYQDALKKLQIEVDARDTFLEKIFREHPDLFFTKFKKAGQNPKFRDELPDEEQVIVYRREYWDSVDFSDTRLLYTSVIDNKLNNYFGQLTTHKPDSIIASADYLLNKTFDYPLFYKYIANWIALKYEPTKTNLMDSEAIFVHMVQNYFTYDRAFWSDSASVYSLQLRAKEMSNSLIGQKGPNVSAKDPDGNIKSIYDLTSDYIVVYMFNPTCEHCMVETPKLVSLYNQQKEHLFDVYSIAIETQDEEWKNYLIKNKVPFTSVFDPTNQAIYATYYVDITPEIYILNKERIIIAKNIKVDQIMEAIRLDQNKK
ncbi:MAG: redoxin domain-containing protein [Saprospiraceae bacterium]|nr:redoxin domain-containing protein [Saprospiraceae bacterium]